MAISNVPLYYVFPNPDGDDITSLKDLFERVRATRLKQACSLKDTRLWLFLENGVYDQGGAELVLPSSITIVGESREKTIISNSAGVKIYFPSVAPILLKNMTVRASSGSGIVVSSDRKGCNMENLLIEACGRHGVVAHCQATMRDVEIRGCVQSGLYVLSCERVVTVVTISGATTVHHNCTGKHHLNFGLTTDIHSKISLVRPLTRKSLSFDNVDAFEDIRVDGNRGNWNKNSNIRIVDDVGKILESVEPIVRAPPGPGDDTDTIGQCLLLSWLVTTLVRKKDLNRSQYIRPYCKTCIHHW